MSDQNVQDALDAICRILLRSSLSVRDHEGRWIPFHAGMLDGEIERIRELRERREHEEAMAE